MPCAKYDSAILTKKLGEMYDIEIQDKVVTLALIDIEVCKSMTDKISYTVPEFHIKFPASKGKILQC